MIVNSLSLLFPPGSDDSCNTITDETMHDLGFDVFINNVAKNKRESDLIYRMLTRFPQDAATVQYRLDIFEDVLTHPKLRNEILALLEQVDFLKTYGSFGKETDAGSIWALVHRMEEMRDYIICIEKLYTCLKDAQIHSEGLKNLYEYARQRYLDRGFEKLKQDVEALHADTSNIKSVTLGVNLDERFEAKSLGLISINSKPFVRSDIFKNFTDILAVNDELASSSEWDEKMNYRIPDKMINLENTRLNKAIDAFATSKRVSAQTGLAAGLTPVPPGDVTGDVMSYLDKIATMMLNRTAKNLKHLITKDSGGDIQEIISLIPEFLFYVRWAEHVELLRSKGFLLCKPVVLAEDTNTSAITARDIYNLKLAESHLATSGSASDIVLNTLTFDHEHMIYILTGANRGGKTTITQALGINAILAQHGIFVPGRAFRFSVFDEVHTHFPADEDKTMDLGRLGEECRRFREIFLKSSDKSLILLNESFSTTSFEEGYFIACDAIRALRAKGVRTIYNTHMHKLGRELDTFNNEPGKGLVSSLTVVAEEGTRSYLVKIAPPEGTSYAHDIALKYGVTYDMLMNPDIQ